MIHWRITCYIVVAFLALFVGKMLHDEMTARGNLPQIENKADSITSLYKTQVDSLLEYSKRQDSVIATYQGKAKSLSAKSATHIEKADSLSVLADTATEIASKYEAKVEENSELREAVSDLSEAVASLDKALELRTYERDSLSLALKASVNKLEAVESLVKEAVSEARSAKRQLRLSKAATIVGSVLVVAALIR